MATDKPPPIIFDRFRRLLAPPISPDDEYQTFAFGVLHYTLLLLIGIAAVLSLFSPSAAQYIFVPVLLFILLFCYFLMRVNRHRMAQVLFLAGLWLVVTIASFSQNGLRNAIISTYAIVIIYSAVLFSERAVILMTGLSILSLVVLLAGENRGFLPLHTISLSLVDRFFQQVALFGAVGVLLGSGARLVRTGYARIQRSEHLLRQRNRELEMQIAEREKTEAALKESEKRYRVIGEMISDFAYAYDIEPDGGTIPVWITGESFKRVTGYEWEETNTTFRLYHPDDMEKVRRHVQQTAQGQPTPGDYRIVTKSGEIRWVHVERRVERSETDNRPVRFYGSAQDITQNVRAKEAILRLNQELENKAVQLAALNKIARDISAVTDLSSTLRRVLEKLQTLLPLDVFYVALHDPDTQTISFPVMYDMGQFWNQPPGTLSPSAWITQVLQTGQAMLLNRTPEQIEASRKTHKRLGAADQVSASVLMTPLIIGSPASVAQP